MPRLSSSKLLTLHARPPASITTGCETKVVDGAMPSRSAVASTNGLNAEPGWRSPCVARLNWLCVVVAAADHRHHLAGVDVDRDERGVGPIEGGSTFAIASRASFCSPRSIVVLTLHPAAEHVLAP